MNARAQRVLSEAMALTTDERAVLVLELIRTLEDEVDADAEELWSKELARRALDAVDGRTASEDLDTYLDEVEAKLAPR